MFRFEAGDAEGAEDDLTWAETRLKSVAKASRDHDLSLLNKAAYHMAQGEALMALQVYGDISRTAGHAHETIAISRLGASRIRHGLGHLFDAGRHAWNAHKHAIMAVQHQMAIEAGSMFLDLAIGHQSTDAPPMHVQVEEAKPLDLEDEPPTLAVHPDDIHGVFDWCVEHLEKGWGGPERPAVRAMLTLAHRLEKMDRFATLMASPESGSGSDVGCGGPSVFIHARRNGGVGQALGRTHDALRCHSALAVCENSSEFFEFLFRPSFHGRYGTPPLNVSDVLVVNPPACRRGRWNHHMGNPSLWVVCLVPRNDGSGEARFFLQFSVQGLLG